MKKVPVLLMVLIVMSLFMTSAALATSGSIDTGDVLYSAPYSEIFTKNIVPNIQLIDPGSIKVSISWVTPTLSFDKRALIDNAGNTVRYYGLKTDQTVDFKVDNNSLSGTIFDGTIYVIPTFVRTNAQEALSSNIRVLMTGQDAEMTLAKGTSSSAVKLNYLNVLEQYLAKDQPATLLKGSATNQEIEAIMTMQVTFNISTTKR